MEFLNKIFQGLFDKNDEKSDSIEEDDVFSINENIEEQENYVTCPHCAEQLNDNAKYCFRCGAIVDLTVICSKCGSEIPSIALFCHKCGARAEKSK